MRDAFGVPCEAVAKHRSKVSKGILAPISRALDNRALRLGQSLAPVGSRLANGAEVAGHTVARGALGSRKVTTSIAREGKEIGSVRSIVTPTKHVVVDNATVAYGERGKGVGTSALKMLTDNAPKSKTPGVYWLADGNGGTMHGARAWKHGDAQYVRGVPFIPGHARSALKDASPEARKRGIRFVRRARLGLAKPSQMASEAGPEAHEALNGLPWAARVKGGQPFARKTAIGTGVVGTGVVAEEGVRRHKIKKDAFGVEISKALKLPDGSWTRLRAVPRHNPFTGAHSQNSVMAYRRGKLVGGLHMVAGEPDKGLILGVAVVPKAQRKGIATAMWNRAKSKGFDPKHSDARTPDGDAWSKAVGGPRPVNSSAFE